MFERIKKIFKSNYYGVDVRCNQCNETRNYTIKKGTKINTTEHCHFFPEDLEPDKITNWRAIMNGKV